MPDTDEFQKYKNKLQPIIEGLMREVDPNENLDSAIIGFVISRRPLGLIKFGNIGNTGQDLVQLCALLATLAAQHMQFPETQGGDMPFAEIDCDDFRTGEKPEEIADELAKTILVTNMEQSRIQQVKELAQRYIIARSPKDEDRSS